MKSPTHRQQGCLLQLWWHFPCYFPRPHYHHLYHLRCRCSKPRCDKAISEIFASCFLLRVQPEVPNVTNGCFSKSLADGRRFAFLCKHRRTKSLKFLLKLLPSSAGAGFFGIKNRTRKACICEYGGCPFANSIAVIPKDHMSAAVS